MGTEILNQRLYFVLIILAETQESWKDLTSEEGKKVLMEHCRWGGEMKSKDKLLFAGPMDVELTSTHKVNPIGHQTGLILLKVTSREEAEEWAYKDPFHVHGFRRNAVHSLKNTMTDDSLNERLAHLLT